ncbi:beta-glucosidase [Haploplasma modicum]|uniref:beta-glucosidase n=1 Tax=Haploplasma modicum TaxID=2150 RepID=UPI00214CC079|nr:glycoside hydrolase family 3 C-terminal domain-containing protein [Haploplasma modicum]MCR1808803.1 glycoside hydrolase family 3 C-terminal domain-containing protein [Haploplasma modicum]
MKLTIDERIKLLDGSDVWRTKTLDKLKPFMMADGPHGLRKQNSLGDNLGINGSVISVCYPTASLLAATFDRRAVEIVAESLAIDAKSNDVNMILGPGINIKRNPLCGRNFEYFSEDPYLTGMLARSYIRKIEENNVGTSVKHFFANNQEKYRFLIDSVVDERTLNDIYIRAFKMALKENPASIMASYNKINGIYATEHPTIEKLLRKELRYEGVLVSDWGAINNRVSALKVGLDLEMPSSLGYNSKKIEAALEKDPSLEKQIHKSSNRIVEMINKYQNLENTKNDPAKHHENAIKVAEEGLVLLKNEEDILPLNKSSEVVLIGGFIDKIRFQGGGSSNINPYLVEEIKDYAQEYFNNLKLAKGYLLETDKNDNELMIEAIDLASNSKNVVYFMGLPDRLETEGLDRKNIDIPKNQLDLLESLIKVNSNIIVVLLTGSVLKLDFKDNVKAILLSYLAGEGATIAILNTLIGTNNPSGRLPETWIKDLSDVPFKIGNNNNALYYDDLIFVGYRYYNSFDVKVNYPFGYGLSYSKLKYSNYSFKESDKLITITFNLENLSNYKTKEVIQIYREIDESKTYQAKRELVAFDKVLLMPFEKIDVSIEVKKRDLMFYDISTKKEILESNNYKFIIAKNVNEDIYSFDLKINNKDIEPKFKNPWLLYKDIKFDSLFDYKLPDENITYEKPFTLNSPLLALRKSFMGRIIVKFIIKEATNELKDADDFVRDNIRETLLETPMRCIASFGSGVINFKMAEGLIDISNNKIFKGIKKFKKGQKELKNE